MDGGRELLGRREETEEEGRPDQAKGLVILLKDS
jgi:hypothetical protein